MHRPRHRSTTPLTGALLAASLLAAAAAGGTPEPPAAEQLLARSIAFHDPAAVWSSGVFRLRLEGTQPGAEPTRTTVVIDNAEGRFQYQREVQGHRIEAAVTGAECWTRLDGSSQPTAEQVRRFGLSCEQMRRTRDYYVYLWGLPMKLRDAGTRIDPRVRAVRFRGHEVWQMSVTYDPEIGDDVWTFYFDRGTAALVGYRFRHGDAPDGGEYVVLEQLAEGGGLRLPRVRTWYRSDDDTLLGSDTLLTIERLSRDR